MNVATDSIRLLVFLLPGFLAMKIVALKCDVGEQAQHETLINALLYSIVVYMVLGALNLETDLTRPGAILSAIALAVLLGLVAAEAKNREWLSRALPSERFGISTQDKISHGKAAKELFGHWPLIGLEDGKELFGFIKSVDTDTHEMLVKEARWLVGGALVGAPSWVYLPPETKLLYIRAAAQISRRSPNA